MSSLHFKHFNEPQPYVTLFQAMRAFTYAEDNIWFLEHLPVFTQGQAGKPEHILKTTDIPIVQSDRGGQVTYHGPGQLIIYFLLDLKRRNLSVKTLTDLLQQSGIDLLKQYGIKGHTQTGAPGIYVDGAKILSLGLRIRKGCSYHGIALNVNMDLTPFDYINPCGMQQLKMTQISDVVPHITVPDVCEAIKPILLAHFKEASS
jgi:lipoyl(octanoyl) transferase